MALRMKWCKFRSGCGNSLRMDVCLEKSNGGFSEGGFSNSRFVLKPDVAIASEVSILSRNSFAMTDFHAKKMQTFSYLKTPFLEPAISRVKLAKFSAKLVANFWRSLAGDFRASFAGKIVRNIFHQNSTANFTIKLHYEVLGCGGLRQNSLAIANATAWCTQV